MVDITVKDAVNRLKEVEEVDYIKPLLGNDNICLAAVDAMRHAMLFGLRITVSNDENVKRGLITYKNAYEMRHGTEAWKKKEGEVEPTGCIISVALPADTGTAIEWYTLESFLDSLGGDVWFSSSEGQWLLLETKEKRDIEQDRARRKRKKQQEKENLSKSKWVKSLRASHDAGAVPWIDYNRRSPLNYFGTTNQPTNPDLASRAAQALRGTAAGEGVWAQRRG